MAEDLEIAEVTDLEAEVAVAADEDTEAVAEEIVVMAEVVEEVADTVAVVAGIEATAGIVDMETVAGTDTVAAVVEDMAVDVVEAVEVVTMEAMEATTTVTMEVINRKYSSFLQNIYKNQMYSTILEKYKKASFAIFCMRSEISQTLNMKCKRVQNIACEC